jgi:hypothetical protein
MQIIDTLFPGGWQHFLIGGLWIGTGIALLFITTGLIGGISTVYSSTWSYLSRAVFFQQPRLTGSRAWRLIYAAGLVLGAGIWLVVAAPAGAVVTSVPWWQPFWPARWSSRS